MLQEKIIKMLQQINEDIMLYDGMDMIEDGIIDSLEIMEIASEAEKEFDIEFDANDILPENFTCVNSIISLIRGKMG